MPNRNRAAGDYLERQTRAALTEHGWLTIRAGGSLGPADVWALRNGNTPLLIACKTNGKISPAERLALIDAARQAGARPLLAYRSRRGYVDIAVVQPTPVMIVLDSLKVPPRRKDDPDDDA